MQILHDMPKKFILSDGKNKLSVKLSLTKSINGNEFYTLCSSKLYYDAIIPLMISFTDPTQNTTINSTSCYIVNIHKTNDLTGSDIMNIALKFVKDIGVKYVYIRDSSYNIINNKKIPLSFMYLLKNYKTYYYKFGFVFTTYGQSNLNGYLTSFSSVEKLHNYIVKTINKIRQYKTKNIIDTCNNILSIVDNSDLKIICKGKSEMMQNLFTNIYLKKIDNIIEKKKVLDIIQILQNCNFDYLYECLLHLFTIKHNDCIILFDFCNTIYYAYISDKKIVRLSFQKYFNRLLNIVSNYLQLLVID